MLCSVEVTQVAVIIHLLLHQTSADMHTITYLAEPIHDSAQIQSLHSSDRRLLQQLVQLIL